MLLDIAAEQPNGELLLQKHFIALLTSIWKTTARTDSRQNHASSRNGFSFSGRFFTSANQNSLISLKEPAERMNFTNLGRVRSFLASALHDASISQHDGRAHQSNHGEDTRAIAEQLELTLEFPREMDDSLDPFPSVVDVRVIGSDSLQSTNNNVEKENYLRSSCDVSENRFR